MITQELKQLKTGPRDLRKFGLTIGGVFAGLALWLWLRHKPYYWYCLIPAVPLVGLGLACPRSLKWIYVGWMALAFVLGHIVSTLLLVVFFFLVVTPVGLLARCFGKDFLNRKIATGTTSYWLPRDLSKSRQKREYEQQF